MDAKGNANPAGSGEDRRSRIERKLREHLGALHVEVLDESHLHAGHPGAAGGAGHFRALVVSHRFEGLGLVEAQRLVFAALAGEMGSEIHALSVRTLTPPEWGSGGSRSPTGNPVSRGRS